MEKPENMEKPEREKKEFTLTLEETITQDFVVEAYDEEEVRNLVKKLYEDEMIVLTDPNSMTMSMMVNNDGLEVIDSWNKRDIKSHPKDKMDPRDYDPILIDALFHANEEGNDVFNELVESMFDESLFEMHDDKEKVDNKEGGDENE